jgi:hypothetical protein
MQVPWFFATTPAPRPAARSLRRHAGWWSRLARRYVAWAERSHREVGARAAGR